MKLSDIINRTQRPLPWAEAENIPWNEPEFSGRMLAEHLRQDHDAASRRPSKIDRQVEWIHSHVLDGHPAKVLDLGCGPGLYTSRLARLGLECRGIDFSPASIAFAKKQAARDRENCVYAQEDLRTSEYGTGYGLVMLIYGEFNAFRRADARRILQKSYAALSTNGALLLEAHTFEAVRDMGEERTSWYSAESGLFSDRPYICLKESFWDGETRAATIRYFVVDVATAEVTLYAQSMQAYTEFEYRTTLTNIGFADVQFFPSVMGTAAFDEPGFVAIQARKGP